jgi:hypothetical protein
MFPAIIGKSIFEQCTNSVLCLFIAAAASAACGNRFLIRNGRGEKRNNIKIWVNRALPYAKYASFALPL